MSAADHVDLEGRDFTLRFASAAPLEGVRLIVLRRNLDGGQEATAEFPLPFEELRRILGGGTFQRSGAEGFLLVRATKEGTWFLFEDPSHGLSGSCLIASHTLREAFLKIDERADP